MVDSSLGGSWALLGALGGSWGSWLDQGYGVDSYTGESKK
tara:strand:+ start:1485 stop:1604 length:120 start_codon:yes stop_codon:yes gene_type:complete